MAGAEERFSVVIVGAGSGGLTAALFAAKLGAKACLIERAHVGGDCTWTGCVPSKALIKCAKMAHHARHASEYGVLGVPDPAAVRVDMQQVHDYVQRTIGEVYRHETPQVFEDQGIRVFRGTGAFVDAHRMHITPSAPSASRGGEGEAHMDKPVTIYGERYLLCTGASPCLRPFLTESGVPFMTYENIFDVTELPESMLVLGGGPIGAEIAQAYQRFGCQVTIVASKILPKEDEDARKVIAKVFEEEGIKHLVGRAASVAKLDGGRVKVTTDKGETAEAALLFCALGRDPSIAALDLDKAGVAFTDKGITVDDKLRTNVKNIYAAGDCVGSQQFTHYAGWQAFMAVRNFILPSSSSGVNELVPRVTFTDPEVAAVGLTEEEFRAQYGDKGVVLLRGLDHVDRAVCENEHEHGFFKLMYTPDQTIRGATIVCQRAGELINEIAVAMDHGVKLKGIGRTIHAYPSFGFGVQQMGSDVAIDALFKGLTGKLINLLKKA